MPGDSFLTQLDRPKALRQATPSRCFLVPCLPITINPVEQSLGWASALMFCPGFIALPWGKEACPAPLPLAQQAAPLLEGGVRWTLNPTLQLCWGPAPEDSYPLIYPLLEWYLKGSSNWDTHDSARVYLPEEVYQRSWEQAPRESLWKPLALSPDLTTQAPTYRVRESQSSRTLVLMP